MQNELQMTMDNKKDCIALHFPHNKFLKFCRDLNLILYLESLINNTIEEPLMLNFRNNKL